MCQSGALLLLTSLFGVCLLAAAITNNADLIWYERDSQEPHNYFAREPIPEGLIRAQRIVVNQKLPLLWEVKFAFFDNLESLAIDDCGVNEIRPKTFKDLKPLTNLSLTRNNIREVREEVFNFVQIKNLNFSHNKISIIAPGAFDNMPDLETVVLDFNELKHWNGDWFFNCTNIRTVSITHNFLEEIPDGAFKNFPDDEENGNVNLYFSYNKIKEIESDAFENLEYLNDLFLDWNELEEVKDDSLRKLHRVKYLNLNGNSVQCLSNVTLDIIFEVSELVSLNENPLECECLKVLQQLKENKHKLQISQQSDKDC